MKVISKIFVSVMAVLIIGGVSILSLPINVYATDCKAITKVQVEADTAGTGVKKDCPCESAALIDDYSSIGVGVDCSKSGDSANCLFGTYMDGAVQKNCMFTTITNTALFLVGAISVIMLIYGGIRYTVSGGDSTAVGNAKNTILYAIVGIIVSILAFALVQFVIGQLANK